MATAVEIANMALARAGDEVISTYPDSSTHRARRVSLFFDSARKRALSLGNWTCCSKRVKLPALAAAPAWGFTYQYQLPGDFIRLSAIEDAGEDYTFELENRVLLTDLESPLSVKYVFDDSDVTHFDPMLTHVMVLGLAIDLIEPLTESNTKKDMLMKELELWLPKATSVNGRNRAPQQPKETSWLRARALRS